MTQETARTGRWMSIPALLAVLALAGCAPSQATEIEARADEGATPWTGLQAQDSNDDFHFVVVADRTGGERPGVFPAAMPKVNLLRPAFVVSVGDLIEGYTKNRAELDRQWDEFASFIDTLEAPFFHVAGNHDMSNALMAEAWRERFGPSFYHFLYKDTLFLALNSELFGMVGDPGRPVPGPWTQQQQLAYIAEVLAAHPNPRWTIILIHQPLWDYGENPRGDWAKVEAMLGERDYTVFAGHFHRYTKHVRNNRKHITLASTGGVSSLRGLPYGEFDHVAWVTMTADGPRIANLMLDGIQDEDLVTTASRTAVRALTRGIESLAKFQEGDSFQTGTASFKLRNPLSAALQVHPRVQAGADLRELDPPPPFTLGPGESRQLDVALRSDSPKGWGDLAPGRIIWSLSTLAADRPLRFDALSALLPVAPMPMPTGEAPTVDGLLDDWAVLPYNVQRQGDVFQASISAAPTPADLSYRFGVREADGDIYFAFAVTDDSLYGPDWEGPRYQDHVLISVDARPDPERSENRPLSEALSSGELTRLAVDYLTVGNPRPDPFLDFLADARAAIDWRILPSEVGYNAEAKVSGAFLDAQHGSPWQAVRITVTVTDADPQEPGRLALHWQPDRFGEAPVAGTGTFLRTSAVRSRPPAD